ncbi:phosphate-regulating neutral endopeptidase PHEX-like [Brevipalpus obovatus]|uniref:phosphate-regulating neutral endopeptidase PHEX-like n=1 Tax=Brevipalpus obovatus TaxID=246614 RepID=UPI003D9F7545
MNRSCCGEPMNLRTVKMVCRQVDENDNDIEVSCGKNRQVNRRFNWTRKFYFFEIAFYIASLLAITFLIILVYMFTGEQVKETKCPTVTILKPKNVYRADFIGGVRDPLRPELALCGPCPRVTCPRCIVPECNCTICPTTLEPDGNRSMEYDGETMSSSTTLDLKFSCPPCPLSAYNESIGCAFNTSIISPQPSSSPLPSVTSTETTITTYTEEYRTKDLCLTKNCVIEASNLLKILDDKPLECDTFSQSLCFEQSMILLNKPSEDINWIRTNLDPNSSSILQKIISPENKMKPVFRQLENFRKSCKDSFSRESRDHKPLKDLIDAVGGWPLLGKSDQCGTFFNLTGFLTRIRNLGALDTSLFSLDINLEFNEISDPLVVISPPTLGLKLQDYRQQKWRLYYELMMDTMLKLGATKKGAQDAIHEILKVEFDIAAILMSSNDTTWEIVSANQMNSIFPSIDWERFLRGYEGLNATGQEYFKVFNIDVLRNIGTIVTSSEKRIICNYMVWRVAMECIPRLSRSWRELYFTKMRINETRSLQEFCDHQVMHHFHNVLPLLYYRENYNDLEMIGFRKMIGRAVNYTSLVLVNRLGDNSTIQDSQKRLNSLRLYINEMNRFVRTDTIEKIHNNLFIREGEYFLNMLELRKFARKNQVEVFKARDPAMINFMGPGVGQKSSVRYFADHLLNILATITSESYLTDLNFLNYSSIGLRLVHEILRLLFKPTSLSYTPGSNETMQAIKFIDYDMINLNCSLRDIYTKSNSTQRRTMVMDFLAALITEKTFFSDDRPMDKVDHLPGLNQNANQLFFINLAKTFCSRKLFEEKGHSSEILNATSQKFDAIVAQLDEFNKSYKCSKNSNLERC